MTRTTKRNPALAELATRADRLNKEVEKRCDDKQQIKALRPSKVATLEAAIDAVSDRGLNYGSSEDNFDRIARRWEVHFLNRYGVLQKVDAHDVAMMMADVKLARLENAPGHKDSWVDLAGYAACGNSLPVHDDAEG